MKKNKSQGLLIVAAGIALSLVSVFGYDLGIARSPSFGAFQIAGTLVGVILIIWGLTRVLGKKS